MPFTEWRKIFEIALSLESLRLLFDFGLLVLIWLVQLVIYPGFRYYSKEKLMVWHQKYTFGISWVVIPLLFGQLILAGLQMYQDLNLYTIVSMALITSVWLSTFLQFVPMHNTISKGVFDNNLLNRLIKWNWIRTFLWNLLFLYSLINFMESITF